MSDNPPTHDDAESEAGRVEKPTAHFLQDLEAALTQERQLRETAERQLHEARTQLERCQEALRAAAETMDDCRELIRRQHLDGPYLADQKAALEAAADTLYDAAVEVRFLLAQPTPSPPPDTEGQ